MCTDIMKSNVPGKTSGWSQEREKELQTSSKLNEKNVLALKNADKADDDMGLATPAGITVESATPVKSELPSLELLKDLVKTVKKS